MNTLVSSLYVLVGLYIGSYCVVDKKTDLPDISSDPSYLLSYSSTFDSPSSDNEKTNKESITELEKKLKSLDELKDALKRKALEAMKRYIENHLEDDPAAVLKKAAEESKKKVASGDKIKDAGINDYIEKIKSSIFKKVMDVWVYRVTGTGQTTGHIAELSVENGSPYVIDIIPETFFIPSTGRYQSYVGQIPPDIQIQPNRSATIPVMGNCADPYSPPVPVGEDAPDIMEWIPVHTGQTPNLTHTDTPLDVGTGISLFVNDLPTASAFDPSQIYTIKNSPSFSPGTGKDTSVVLTWPGTDIVIGGNISLSEDPVTVAPLVVSAHENIVLAAPVIQSGGFYITPFSLDSIRENESVVQQTFWVFTAALAGDPYTEEDFAQNVYEQFESTTGITITAIPDEQKEKVDEGVDDFWNAFMATGLEAKIFKKEMEEKEYVEVATSTHGCKESYTLNMDPRVDFDMKITEEWGNNRERARIIRKVRDDLHAEIQVTPKGLSTEFDINRHPTSATSFWKAGTVGGFGSAYAKTWFVNENGKSKWVWGTEKLVTKASGKMDFSLSYAHDDKCRAMVAGTAVIRIRATSSALDAMAGNTQNENDTDQLQFLRGTKYAAKKALEWLILRSRGRAEKPFGKYIKDDIQDQLEGQVKEAVEAEVMEQAEKYLGQYLEKMGFSVSDIMNLNKNIPSLDELIEETFGIKIPTMEELEAFISDGIDASLNLFFVANTYATTNGSLTVKVGNNTASVRAHTSVHYSRQSTEETAEAIRWTGGECKESIVSDVQPDALTIHTEGMTDMVAEAESQWGFGNGSAEASLESMNLQILAGLCICQSDYRGVDYSVQAEGQIGWYTADESRQESIKRAVDPFLDKLNEDLEMELDKLTRDQLRNYSKEEFKYLVESKVRKWSADHTFAWNKCN